MQIIPALKLFTQLRHQRVLTKTVKYYHYNHNLHFLCICMKKYLAMLCYHHSYNLLNFLRSFCKHVITLTFVPWHEIYYSSGKQVWLFQYVQKSPQRWHAAVVKTHDGNSSNNSHFCSLAVHYEAMKQFTDTKSVEIRFSEILFS